MMRNATNPSLWTVVRTVSRSTLTALALLAVTACVPSSAGTESSIQEGALEGSDAAIVSSDFLPAQSGWSLVWSDEFNGEDLDPSKWAPEVSCWGGGNEERQCYTARNANIQVADGVLRIVARPERWTGPNLPQERRRADDGVRTQPYTSGKIRTRDLAAWRYGRFAARMRLPSGQGTWPAFWMMPSEDHYGTWPLSGEIDIMEAVNLRVGCDECGSEGVENRIQGALHFGFPWPDNTFLVQRSTLPALAGPDEGFHVYAVEWGEGRIDWYVDGQRYFSLAESDWHTGSPRAAGNPLAPFDRPFYLILNLAVGGRLPEQHNETGVDPRAFPAELLVDWVRVYECPSDPEEGLACMSAE